MSSAKHHGGPLTRQLLCGVLCVVVLDDKSFPSWDKCGNSCLRWGRALGRPEQSEQQPCLVCLVTGHGLLKVGQTQSRRKGAGAWDPQVMRNSLPNLGSAPSW